MSCENCGDAFYDGMEVVEKKYADLLSAAKAAVEWMDAMPLEVDVLLPSEYSERLADIYESFRAAIEKAGAK